MDKSELKMEMTKYQEALLSEKLKEEPNFEVIRHIQQKIDEIESYLEDVN
jgi:hypothetical protein